MQKTLAIKNVFPFSDAVKAEINATTASDINKITPIIARIRLPFLFMKCCAPFRNSNDQGWSL